MIVTRDTLAEHLRALGGRYYADVHKPTRLRVFASTGVGTGSYFLGASALGPGKLRRLERRFIRHACRDSRAMRKAEASVEFTTWPRSGDPPYRRVRIENGIVTADEREEPDWSPK